MPSTTPHLLVAGGLVRTVLVQGQGGLLQAPGRAASSRATPAALTSEAGAAAGASRLLPAKGPVRTAAMAMPSIMVREGMSWAVA